MRRYFQNSIQYNIFVIEQSWLEERYPGYCEIVLNIYQHPGPENNTRYRLIEPNQLQMMFQLDERFQLFKVVTDVFIKYLLVGKYNLLQLNLTQNV